MGMKIIDLKQSGELSSTDKGAIMLSETFICQQMTLNQLSTSKKWMDF